jgi:hypothetical protein
VLTDLCLVLRSSCCPICSGEASEAYRRAGNKEFAKFQIEEALDNPYGYDFDYCYDDWLNHQCFSDDACWYQEVEEDSFMWPSMHEAGGGYEFNPCYDDFVDNPSYSGGFSCCGLAEADEEYCFTRASSYEVGHGYEFEGCDNYSHEDYPEDRDDDYHEGWYDDSLAEPYCTEDWSCPEWTKEQFEEYYRMWPTPHEAAQLDLGELLDVARNHFEMQETEKLLREYDFVDDSGNEDVGGIFTDDEYEVVDYVLA